MRIIEVLFDDDTLDPLKLEGHVCGYNIEGHNGGCPMVSFYRNTGESQETYIYPMYSIREIKFIQSKE